jgi:hypothetical protein
MRFFYSYLLIFTLTFVTWVAPAQTILKSKEDSLFNANGEVYFKFTMNDKIRVDSLSRIISVDNFKDGEVFAYANRNEFILFLNLKIDYVLLPPPGSLPTDAELNMGNWQKNGENMTIWNFYPTYPQYVTFMTGFASSYPSICHLDTIGTTIQGRLLLSLKISDSVNYERGVPQVFLTSSIHGDETTGYIMMMHLIDTLLNSYGSSTRLTNLIHNTQIFINPLANPDGTYHGGDGTVGGSIRYNANNVDMNRNYPDPATGPHPTGMWQPETMAFMNYADRLRLTLSMNFHGGAEVVNYPFDTWTTLAADDSWWQYVAHQYADTCHKLGPAGYFTNPYLNGITNGAVWYVVAGGRQDYHTYFKHDRECTLEISLVKTVDASTLLSYWKYNYRSFLNYIEQANYGINGKVYDSVTNAPVGAKVFIAGHDADSSWIYSSLPSGWYFRMIDTGPWNLTFTAPGYYPRTITGVASARHATNRLNVKLRPIDQYWPRSFLAKAINANQIDLSWLKDASNDPVMIAYSTTNTFGTPATGTAYTFGSNISGGGVVFYNGSNTAYSNTYLNPGTIYYYRAWTVRPGNTYSAYQVANATTYCGVYNSFPITEDFATASMQLPNCWSQEATGTNAVYTWTRVYSANAGGTAWEMRLPAQVVNPGTSRLKTCFFNTTGITVMTLSFKYNVRGTNFSGTGTTLKIQSSYDGVNWTDEGWSMVTTSNGNVAGTPVTINITHNLNSPATMIAFVATGNLNRFSYWYIDNVSIKAPGYWNGGTMNALIDWNTGTNWGDGVVPNSGINVYIPPKNFLPLVTNDPLTPAQCKDLLISKNATITVGAGKKIIVNGKMTLQGP